jgi:hypothetical protein
VQPPIVRAPLLSRFRLPYGKLIAFGVTVVVSLLFLIVPVYSNGRTLLEVNGPRVFGALAIPVAIALCPLVSRRLTIPAAVAMLAFSLIAGFSIGLFYLPSTMLLIWPERR